MTTLARRTARPSLKHALGQVVGPARLRTVRDGVWGIADSYLRSLGLNVPYFLDFLVHEIGPTLSWREIQHYLSADQRRLREWLDPLIARFHRERGPSSRRSSRCSRRFDVARRVADGADGLDEGVEKARPLLTSELPETGHSPALDDGQQAYRGANVRRSVAGQVLAGVAQAYLTELGDTVTAADRRVARRLAVIASEVDGFYDQSSQTTVDMMLPGAELGNDSAIDDSNEPGVLQVYDTKPVERGAAGPEPRSGAAKAPKARATGVTADEDQARGPVTADDDVMGGGEEEEDEGGGLHCPACGGQPTLLGQLGQRVHVRCRQCGMDFSVPQDKLPADDGDDDDEAEGEAMSREGSVRAAAKKPTKKAPAKAAPAPHKTATPAPKKAGKKGTKKGRTATADLLPWDHFTRAMRAATTQSGHHAGGAWRVGTVHHGRALDLNIDTYEPDGAPRSSATVTFRMDRQDPAQRVATVEVHDNVIQHETAAYKVKTAQMRNFASEWAQKAVEVARRDLDL